MLCPKVRVGKELFGGFIWHQGGISFLAASGHEASKMVALCAIFQNFATKKVYLYFFLKKKKVLNLKFLVQLKHQRPTKTSEAIIFFTRV